MLAGEFYDTIGNPKKTLSMYQKALEIQPKDIRIMDVIARFYVKNKQLKDAEKYITRILDQSPKYFPTQMLKGELFILQHKYDEAVAIFDMLIKEDPGSDHAYYFKGVALLGKGETSMAKTALSKAVEFNHRFIKAKRLLAETYLREHDFELARKESLEILKIEPKNYQAQLALGIACMYQKKFVESRNIFESLIKLAPKNPEGYFHLGVLQRSLKNYDSALKNLNKAMAINPRRMDVFTNIILLYTDKKDFEAGLLKCDEQLDKLRNDPERKSIVHNLKGRLYLHLQKTKDAEASFKAALKENPNFLPPYYSLSRIYLLEKQENKAIAQYKAVLERNPKQAAPHMLLGIIYDMQKRFDLAKKHYNAALDINPDFYPAANNLAYLLAERGGNLNKALSLAQRAKEMQPDDPNVMDTLGLVYYKKGLYDSAVDELADSVKENPDNAVVHFHLGLAYYKRGDKDLAKTELETALKLDDKFDGADEARKILSEL
jgi:tetratricopeptide (TPR) repeat protein